MKSTYQYIYTYIQISHIHVRAHAKNFKTLQRKKCEENTRSCIQLD